MSFFLTPLELMKKRLKLTGWSTSLPITCLWSTLEPRHCSSSCISSTTTTSIHTRFLSNRFKQMKNKVLKWQPCCPKIVLLRLFQNPNVPGVVIHFCHLIMDQRKTQWFDKDLIQFEHKANQINAMQYNKNQLIIAKSLGYSILIVFNSDDILKSIFISMKLDNVSIFFDFFSFF